jgi:penicillin-binding protein activator
MYRVCAFLAVLMSGCVSPQVQNSGGMAVRDIDPGIRGPVGGVGIEGQDIISMTDQMMRDILGNSFFSGNAVAPRVIIDGEFFVNDSGQAINKNMITERLRANLNRASNGRMLFVGRNYARMVEEERSLKREGVTDVGTTGLTRAQAGVDYRLGGRITSLDSRDTRTGMIQRHTQILFEMVDVENGLIIWSGLYEFARAGADDVVYR